MKSNIIQRYQEFIDYIEFPTIIYMYETNKIIAINDQAKKTINESNNNINLLWLDKKRVKFSRKTLLNGTEIVYNKKIIVGNSIKEIDIEYNIILFGKSHMVFCFFELSDELKFSRYLNNQIPRILWKNEDLIFYGGNKFSKIDMGYDNIDSLNKSIQKEKKYQLDEDEFLINMKNEYNNIEMIRINEEKNVFVKMNKMPIIDREGRNIGIIYIYKLLLSEEQKEKIVNEIVKENNRITKELNKCNDERVCSPLNLSCERKDN